MHHKNLSRATLAVALSLILGFAGAVAAQNIGTIRGQVIGPEGQPWEGLTVKLVNDRGQKAETTTDKDGRFVAPGLGNGKWQIEFFRGEQVVWRVDTQLPTGQEITIPVINFKELMEKTPEGAAAKKKQEEEKSKFENMKANFEAGVQALQTADSLQSGMAKAPADQKEALQQKINEHRESAIKSFLDAEQGVTEKDPNRALILGNLGSAYKSAAKYDEAIDAYTRAIAAKPDPAFHVGLAESQARTNKHTEAMATCGNIPTATGAASAATCYRNLGIVSYNASRDKEAVEALKKATELDPKNPQAWYVMGASLVRLADYKTEAGKISVILQPGTVEAYQKAIEVDPNGPYGAQAKEGLAQLEQMGAGISTSVKSGKRRN